MTPADKRMMELLQKWLASLDLHLQYADLSEAEYLAAQPWPKHDRPTRWIIELARQKTLELKAHQESRISAGDSRFAESLELMGFLANLVGSQHVQRFIPLADPEKERKIPAPRASEDGATRELPKVSATAAPIRKAQPPPESGKPPTATKTTAKAAKKISASSGASSKATSPVLQKKVMADAVRLLNWGKEWHELADLIARIADRPPIAEVRRILRSHKAEIEMQAESDD
jgi:hypothetical protein